MPPAAPATLDAMLDDNPNFCSPLPTVSPIAPFRNPPAIPPKVFPPIVVIPLADLAGLPGTALNSSPPNGYAMNPDFAASPPSKSVIPNIPPIAFDNPDPPTPRGLGVLSYMISK